MIDNEFLSTTKLDKRLFFDIFPLDYVPDDFPLACKHEKRINKKKNRIGYIDPKNYKNNQLEMTAKKVISFVLTPFRYHIISDLEREMTKYSKTNHICSLASQYSYKKQYFSYDVYGEPKEYLFCNHMFFGPAKPVEYLTQLYGEDYMVVPPPEKRRKGWDIYALD